MVDILIVGGCYITIGDGGNIIYNNIGIKDGIITYIGDQKIPARKIINANNMIIFPGFINTHIHFGEYFLKGYDAKYTTEEYILYAEDFNNRNVQYKEQIRQVSTDIVMCEALKYGTTTLMGIRGWNCAEKYGARLFMGYPLMKSDKLQDYLVNAFDNIDKLKADELNEYFVALHSLKWVDDEILTNLSQYMKRNMNIKLSVHICETRDEVNYIKKKYGMTPIEVMEKYELLSGRTLLVHCNYLSDKDIDIIKKYNASVAICPNSNLKLKNRIAPVKKLLKKGINVTLGTDGIATNDSLNLLDSCRTLGLITDIKSIDIIKMITINPEKYFQKNIGEIKIGNKADILIFDKRNLQITRDETFINDLVYANGIVHNTVIINGKIIISDEQKINEEEIYKQKDELIKNLKF